MMKEKVDNHYIDYPEPSEVHQSSVIICDEICILSSIISYIEPYKDPFTD